MSDASREAQRAAFAAFVVARWKAKPHKGAIERVEVKWTSAGVPMLWITVGPEHDSMPGSELRGDWELWQAASRPRGGDDRERCAKACEARAMRERLWLAANRNSISDDCQDRSAARETEAEDCAAAIRALPAAAPDVGEALDVFIKDFSDLMAESHGVDGLHKNGDVATWDELREGGRFEEWLRSFDALLKARSSLARGSS